MKTILNPEEAEQFCMVLRARFEKNMQRHVAIKWDDVAWRLNEYPEKLNSLYLMEQTGGEPDVVMEAPGSTTICFIDCATESPIGRRSLCYDGQALDARKDNKPKDSATGLAEAMGVSLLTEAQYYYLQRHGKFDQKTSSWILTPNEVRRNGGALFGDLRYERVFTYHNGAESYYAARGFRAMLEL